MRNPIASTALRALLFFACLTIVPLGQASAQACNSTISFVGTPRLGSTIQMVISGNSSCHSCLWVSKNPGPTVIGPVTIPIGVPILNAVDYGQLPPSGMLTVPITIPNDPNVIGLRLYFTNVSFPSAQPPSLTNIVFSPAAILTVVP